VTCSTVGEAEAMVRAGVDQVLIANEVIDPAKLARLARLADDAQVTVAVDSSEGVDLLSAAAALALDGVMGYEGRIRPSVPDRGRRIAAAYALLAETRQALRHAGLTADTVSAAGTSTIPEALADPTITELQAGVYSVMEPELMEMGLPFACAAAVRATVISRHADRVVLDVGRRSVGMEYGPPTPIGVPTRSVNVSDEHTTLWTDGRVPALGSQVDLVPAQVRTTFNLHSEVIGVSGGEVVATWPIAARGASR
jgi:D-serine deaminase-like pyridoxal phosphate-dependent protein